MEEDKRPWQEQSSVTGGWQWVAKYQCVAAWESSSWLLQGCMRGCSPDSSSASTGGGRGGTELTADGNFCAWSDTKSFKMQRALKVWQVAESFKVYVFLGMPNVILSSSPGHFSSQRRGFRCIKLNLKASFELFINLIESTTLYKCFSVQTCILISRL